MKKFLSVFMVSTIAICVGTSALAVIVTPDGDPGDIRNTTKEQAGGNVYGRTIEALKNLNTKKDEVNVFEAGKEVSNTIDDSGQKWSAEKKRREQERKRAEEEAARQKRKQEIEEEYEKCKKQFRSADVKGIAYCNVKRADALRESDIEDDKTVDGTNVSPIARRDADEVQAMLDYYKCKETRPETECQKERAAAEEKAKVDYWQKDPIGARKEIDNNYSQCIKGHKKSRQKQSECSQKWKEEMEKAGLTKDGRIVEEKLERNINANSNQQTTNGSQQTTNGTQQTANESQQTAGDTQQAASGSQKSVVEKTREVSEDGSHVRETTHLEYSLRGGTVKPDEGESKESYEARVQEINKDREESLALAKRQYDHAMENARSETDKKIAQRAYERAKKEYKPVLSVYTEEGRQKYDAVEALNKASQQQ